jgi:hypothetical protein
MILHSTISYFPLSPITHGYIILYLVCRSNINSHYPFYDYVYYDKVVGKFYDVELYVREAGCFYVFDDLKLLSLEVDEMLGDGSGSGSLLVIIQLDTRVWMPLVNYLFFSSSTASSGNVNWSTRGAGIEGYDVNGFFFILLL